MVLFKRCAPEGETEKPKNIIQRHFCYYSVGTMKIMTIKRGSGLGEDILAIALQKFIMSISLESVKSKPVVKNQKENLQY